MLDVTGKSFSFIENFYFCKIFFFLGKNGGTHRSSKKEKGKKKKREQREREQKKQLLEQLMLLSMVSFALAKIRIRSKNDFCSRNENLQNALCLECILHLSKS